MADVEEAPRVSKQNMLGFLFEEDDMKTADAACGGDKGPEPPPRGRTQCGLAGINNQGATCYLNSLIQTLVYTPEFRESLFCLGEEELGKLQDADNPEAKVRVIPIQLQRLFVRLLLLNIQAVSTEELTKSFGWTNNEQFIQHDVQELNRILFSAIESSLVGTSGKDIISKLYHGRLVNKITCTECGYVSERQEEFLDLPMSVSGCEGVEDSLKASYIEFEMMEGKNQYRCGRCNKLVDARKGAKIRCLPSILTLSLLRFSFNFQRMERFKETGKFTFPYVIDMKPYCDHPVEGDSLEYELFSVVIHGGGAHGGHYHAYIRDIDELGTWVEPEKEEIVISKTKDSFDVIQCDSPVQLMEYILSREADRGMPLDKVSKEIQNQTGTSWKKRFKGRYGSMTKFLANNSDKFLYDPSQNFVSLKESPQNKNENQNFEFDLGNVEDYFIPDGVNNEDFGAVDNSCSARSKNATLSVEEKYGSNKTKTQLSVEEKYGSGRTKKQLSVEDKYGSSRTKTQISVEGKYSSGRNSAKLNGDEKYGSGRNKNDMVKSSGDTRNTAKSKFIPPGCSDHWFDFNDSRVHPIHLADIEKQFAGRESAYMLFYRKKSMTRPDRAKADPYYGLPEQFVNEILNENEELARQRQDYEDLINTVSIQVHFGDSYIYREGALKPLSSAQKPALKDITIDRRKSTEELYNVICGFYPEYISQHPFQVNIMKELPAGGHLYQPVIESSEMPIMAADISSGTKLFVWDGEKVQGQFIQTGAEFEPVLLTILYGEGLQSACNHGFQKSLTLDEVRIIVSDMVRIPLKQLKLQRIVNQDDESTHVDFSPSDMKLSVQELKLQDGDQLIAVDQSLGMSNKTEPAMQQNITTINITIENRCIDTAQDMVEYSVQKMSVEKDMTVEDLKAIAISTFELESISEGGRLRIDDQTLGLRHPLHGEMTLSEARIGQGCLLVLEPGPAPTSNEITLWFSRTDNKDADCFEIIVLRSLTVAKCLQNMLQKANIPDDGWHLRKTNWCGEADKVLDDPDLSLDASLVNDGDHILLEPGRLPPKGFIRLTVMLYSNIITTSEENKVPANDVKKHIVKVKELYGWHFPELGILVKDDMTFIKVVKQMGCRSNARKTDFSGILSADISQQVKENADCSMGRDVSGDDVRSIQKICDKVLEISENTTNSPPNNPPHRKLSREDVFKPVCPLCLGEVEISKEATLTDLKQQIMTLTSDLCVPTEEFMRLRVIEHGRLMNVLKNKDQVLKRYKLQPNSSIAVQVLSEEENLSDNQIVLDICERKPGTRTYNPPIELIWNTALGTSSLSLRQAISQKIDVGVDVMMIAKHQVQRFEWTVIEDKVKPGNTKGKKKGGNIRQAPYYIKDGDTIGVKNILYDPDNLDDFGTLEDEIGKCCLEAEAEQKRKEREERKKLAGGDFGEWPRPRKPEVGISIQVGDFS